MWRADLLSRCCHSQSGEKEKTAERPEYTGWETGIESAQKLLNLMIITVSLEPPYL